MISIVWFRRSLRLADNESLATAVEASDEVVCAFVLPTADDPTRPGAASASWLRRSLVSLDADLRSRGSALVMRSGPAAEALVRLAGECGATSVRCQRDWTPAGLAEEQEVAAALADTGIAFHAHAGQLAVAPDALGTDRGGYRVFSAFHKAWRQRLEPTAPLSAPARVPGPALLPQTAGPPSEVPGVPDVDRWWHVGELAAHDRLTRFIAEDLTDYDSDRDRPDIEGTSRLSPHLAWGEISLGRSLTRVTAGAQTPSRSCASLHGASSPITCCTTTRSSRPNPFALSTHVFRGATTTSRSKHGRQAVPATRS